ncbi:MAG: hypothetical protein P8N56_00760 [Schleiferiaceae bacterium]|nr:hypothetical protein [Schleiferiaceae bacterium]
MKKLLSILGLAALAISCVKAPSLEEELAGMWNLNDISITGSMNIAGQSLSFTGQDSLIRANNILELTYVEDMENTFTWNQDVRITLNMMGQMFGSDIQDNLSGTWYAVDGGGATPDSIYMTANGETLGFEVLSFLETTLRFRNQTSEVDPTFGETLMTTEYGFDKL